MRMKKKAMALALSLALTVGLCPGMALATEGASASPDLISAKSALTVETQASVSSVVDEAIEAANALPSASKIKLSDNAKLRTALKKLGSSALISTDDLTAEQVSSLMAAIEKYQAADKAMGSLIKSETSATKAKKVTKVKVVAGKKKATVSWGKLGGNYKYEVYYSTKKSSGFKKATTTKAAKATVNKLAAGKKYYFKVRGVRTDIPEAASLNAYKTVYTKYSGTVVSKAIKK